MSQLSVVRDDPIEIEEHPFQAPEGNSPPKLPQLAWDEGDPAAINYRKFGALLAKAGDLFCRSGHDGGLLLVRHDGSTKSITNAADLAPIIVDRVALTIYLDGKPKGSKFSAAHLNAMLKTDAFLSQFDVVDQISKVARYLPNFELIEPGYNDGGPDQRYLFVGEPPKVYDSMDRIIANTPKETEAALKIIGELPDNCTGTISAIVS